MVAGYAGRMIQAKNKAVSGGGEYDL